MGHGPWGRQGVKRRGRCVEDRRVEVFAAFPLDPNLLERGRVDNVGSRYAIMADRGELVTLGGRGMDYVAFMREALGRFG